MKISFSPDQLFDLAGNPLVSGRVSFYLKDSDTLADTYYRDGDSFIEGQNPVILDNSGSFVNTVFLDVAIYDIVVEKYTDGVYHQVNNFDFGFQMPDVKNDTIVNNIDGLELANPELGFVTVVGYDSITYAGPRTYMWDAQCTDAADGGCIIGSQSSENGRWLLLSDLREMPSTYYGVEPGRESNMSAFLTYQPVVGTYGIFMPPVPRFVTGTYTSEGTLTSTKTISFDQGAKFTKAKFACIAAEISEPVSDYVADFQFLHQAYAESSWFRTVKAFWSCGAAELHQSRTNHFENTNLGSQTGLANCRISGRPMTMTGTAGLLITHCEIDDRALSTDWYITFQDMVLTDRWFNDSNYNIGQSTSYRQYANTSSNVLDVSNFQNTNVFVLWAAAWGWTAIDLRNRTVSTITASMPFRNITNATILEAHFSHNIVLSNVVCSSLSFENRNIDVVTKNCTGTIDDARCKTWNDNNSSFALNCDINNYYTQLNWLGTSLNMNQHFIGISSDLDSGLYATQNLVMWRCTLSDGAYIASDSPIFLDCNIANTIIYAYTASVFENNRSTWRCSMEFRNNRFNGSACIKIGAHNGISDHLTEVYECKMAGLAITDNVFNTTVPGISCPFWSGPSLSYRFFNGVTTFVAGTDPTTQTNDYFPVVFEYHGNSGNCPRQYGMATAGDLPGAYAVADGWGVGASAGMFFENGQLASNVFVLPALVSDTYDALPTPTYSGHFAVDKRSVCTSYRMKALFTTNQNGGSCADYPVAAYLPLCAADRSLPNEMFNVYVGSWGVTAQFYGVNPISSAQ